MKTPTKQVPESAGVRPATGSAGILPARAHTSLRTLAPKPRGQDAGAPSVVLSAIVVMLLFGCAVGPDYKRPAVDTPSAYRRAATDTNAPSGPATFADQGWWELYDDPQLNAYIGEALTNSYDIKIAAARVLQAAALAQVTRSQFFPTVNGGGDLFTSRASQRGPTPVPPGTKPDVGYGDLFLAMPAYEVDLWGRIRRANEAARARLLATVDAEMTVRQTLVFNVASAYLRLLELDLELEIGQRSYVSRTNSLEINISRQEGGVASLADVYQSKVLVAQAETSIVRTLRLIEQTENEVNILLGRNPGKVARGIPLVQQKLRASVPPGLPSSILERRPDIRAAEQQLVAANADIGQAKAAFFPQVTLTGLYGHQTVSLGDLFSGASRVWQFGPSVTMPFFTGGRLRGQYKFAKAQFDEALAGYKQTVQNAFRDVSDGLISYQRSQEFTEKQTELTQANRDAADLANIRYIGGVTSYLEVLFNEQQLLDSELRLAEAQLDEFLSVVQLYRALGGGWQTSGPQQVSANTKH